jgi:PmbA protein
MDELLEIGKKAVSHTQKLGANEAEVFLYNENQSSVKFVGGIFASRGGAVKGFRGTLAKIGESWIKKKGIPTIKNGVKAGVGIRAVINKAIGFSSVSSIEEEKVLKAVEEATKIAKIRPPDPNWVSLPEDKTPIKEGGIFDKRVSELQIEEMLDLCASCCVIAGDFDKRIVQTMAAISASSVSFAVVNTNGVEVFDRGTSFNALVGTRAKSKGEEVSSGDLLTSRTFTKDLQSIAVNAAKKTTECFGKKALPEKYVGSVVFENLSWNQLFSVIFTFGISALNIQENRSVYKGKMGSQIATESVSIVDDGTLPEGFGTAKVDDEGVPRQRTPIIEKGVLSNIIYDNYTAKRGKRESTANASRQGRVIAPYANQPSIRPSNLVLTPEKGSLEELVSQIKEGVLVRGQLIGALHSNVITGDFSVTADNSFKIENGQVAFPLKACTVAGNLYDALNHVMAIGNDSKTVANVVCPSIIIDKIVVAT